MFSFFSKNINLNNIKNIKDVTKVANFFITEKKWALGYNLIKNAKKFENENYHFNIIKAKDDIKKQEQITVLYEKNDLQLDQLKEKIESEEEKFNVLPEKVKSFDDVIKAIKLYVILTEWENAYNAIKEITEIEKNSLTRLTENLERNLDDNSGIREKEKQERLYTKKIKRLDKLYQEIRVKEKNYINKEEVQKFKIRFKKIKSEINFLSKTGKNSQALKILKSFLEKNNTNPSVIKLYNKEKTRILKNIKVEANRAEKKAEKNIREQASILAGKTIKIDMSEGEIDEKKKKSLIDSLKLKLNFYNDFKEKIRKKKLVQEVSLLIEENEAINKEITQEKLESIHKGLTKEISSNKVIGYDLYGKILGADKISGDTFGLFNGKDKYNFFLGDATGHGIRAGLIVTLLTRLFNNFAPKKDIQELAFEINNGLKQDLQSRNFITGVLFEISKANINKIRYVGMGHEPMFIYRKNINQVQKVIPGGLASGIRMIKDINQIKVKTLLIEDGDIIMTYSDGIIEAKGMEGTFYGLARLEKTFWNLCQTEVNVSDIYEKLLDDLVLFRGGSNFDDDVTILIIKRDKNTEQLGKDSEEIKKLKKTQNLTNKEINTLVGKNTDQIKIELKRIKKDKKLNLILQNLKKYYQIGEFLKLKQEAIRYIKEGWIHKDINFYLKKAIDNETKYKIHQKNKKVENRYNVLEQLMKSRDYDTVIQEIEIIISKDGDI